MRREGEEDGGVDVLYDTVAESRMAAADAADEAEVVAAESRVVSAAVPRATTAGDWRVKQPR